MSNNNISSSGFVPIKVGTELENIETISFVTPIPTKSREVKYEEQLIMVVEKIIKDILKDQKETLLNDCKKICISIESNNTEEYFDEDLVYSVSSRSYDIDNRKVLINFKDNDKVQENYITMVVKFILIEFIEKED